MCKLEQIISFGMLSNLAQRYNQGQNINKVELHATIESCKRSHDDVIDNNNSLTIEQKKNATGCSPKWQVMQKTISNNVCAMNIG